MKLAEVREVEELDERFRLVTLGGDALQGVTWTPGQKVQIAMGGWAYRTYTPISWDAVQGTTKLLLFLHGESPGAQWGRSLKKGDTCTLFGPRDSIDLNKLDRPALLFGDETSFALAHSIRFTERRGQGQDDVRLLFEVTSKKTSERILEQLGLSSADLVERTPHDSHLSELETLASTHLKTTLIKSCALSGKASSIQRLNKHLRSHGLSSREIRAKAYWAPGRVGLD